MRGRLRTLPAAAGAALLLAALGGCGERSDAPRHPGAAVYQRHCFACHQAGIAGAPRFADREAWAPRLAKGREALIESVRRGMPPGMPARGACATCDDQALADAVDYMLIYLQ